MDSKRHEEARRATRIQQVVSQYVAQRSTGEPVDAEDLVRQHADLLPELRDALAHQRLVVQARKDFLRAQNPRSAGPTLPAGSAHETAAKLVVRCPHCSDSVEILVDVPWSDITCVGCGRVFSLVADHFATRDAPSLKQIAHFELIERIGIGGFGTVWKARDTILDRTVALKLPRRGQLTEDETEMFLREARAAAQLRHPNIVSVHEVGRTEDTVYIVSDIVRGVLLSEWMAIRVPSPRETAELCRKIAEALHHAHQAGIVHRDLKPGNIMVDANDEPHIMDFGLAKRDAGEVTMTIDGQVLGTPAYMAPEQAMGKAHLSSPCTDIYSLGVILFELLTGELPFRGNTNMLIHQVLNDEPPSPRRLNHLIPVDLETICLRCMEKDPERRIGSARLLAEELERFLNRQPILSRPVGPLTRALRWCWRRQTISALILAFVAALTVGSSISTYFALLAAGFRREVEGFRQEVQAKESEIQETRNWVTETSSFVLGASAILRSPYNRQLQTAAPLWPVRPGDALLLLEDEDRCPANRRDFAWRYYHAQANLLHQVVPLPADTVDQIQFADDNRSLIVRSGPHRWTLTCSEDDWWRLTDRSSTDSSDRGPADTEANETSDTRAAPGSHWIVTLDEGMCLTDRSDAQRQMHLTWIGGRALQGTVSSDDRWAAMATDVGALCIWRLERRTASWTAKLPQVLQLEFSRDGQLLAAATEQELRLFDSLSGEPGDPIVLEGRIRDLAWSPDGRFLAYCLVDGGSRIVDLNGHRQEVAPAGSYTCLLVESNGSLLLGDESGRVVSWSMARRSAEERLKLDQAISDLVQSRSGKVLLVASGPRIYALRSGDAEPLVLKAEGQTADIVKLAMLDDTDSALSLSADGEVRRWRLNWQQRKWREARLTDSASGSGTAEISPDGQTFATLEGDRVMLWDARVGEFRGAIKADAELRLARFCPQPIVAASRLVVADEAGNIEMWTGDGMARQPSVYLGGVVRSMHAVGHTDELLFAGDFSRVAIVKPGELTLPHMARSSGPARNVAASRGSEPVVAVGRWKGAIDIYRLRPATHELTWEESIEREGALAELQLSEDGRQMAALTGGGTLLGWRHDGSSYTPSAVPDEAATSDASALLISADATTWLVGTRSGQLQHWTPNNDDVWQLQSTDSLHDATICDLQWIGAGVVASVGDDGQLVVWDVRRRRRIAKVPQRPTSCLATHPGLSLLAVGAGEGIDIWKLDHDKLRRVGQPLSEHRGEIVAISFTADGQSVVSSSEDRSVKVWRTPGAAATEPPASEQRPATSVVPESVRQFFEQPRP